MDNKYIKHIVDYFFKHEVSYNIRMRVYNRILSEDEESIDLVLRSQWDSIAMEEESSNRTKIPFYRLRYVKLAAMWTIPIILACSLLVFVLRNRENEPQMQQCFAELSDVRMVLLPDSTKVWLNSGSVLLYPDNYKDKRYAYIYGEAFFDVHKDKNHPFSVITRNMEIKVLGTTFNVNAYTDAKIESVTLESGQVEASLANGDVYKITPNQRLSYNCVSKSADIEYDNEIDRYSCWRNGELYFYDITFKEAMLSVGHYFGLRPIIINPDYDKQIIRARFSKNESIENVMGIIHEIMPEITYEVTDKSIIIR